MQTDEKKLDVLDLDLMKTLADAGVIPANVPEPVLRVFIKACEKHDLSPIKREIYLVKYNIKQKDATWKVQYHTIVGIDGLRIKATRTGEYFGKDDAKFNMDSAGNFKTAAELKEAGELPRSCTMTIYRLVSGQKCAFTKTVLYDEYAPKKNPNKWTKWDGMPFNMIEKCTEAAVYRIAFSDETSNLHIHEEQHAYENTTISAQPDTDDFYDNDDEPADQEIESLELKIRNLLSGYKGNDKSTIIDQLKADYQNQEKKIDAQYLKAVIKKINHEG